MGFLKNMTIKSTTKKRASRLRVVLDQSGGDKLETLKQFARDLELPIDYPPGITWVHVFGYIVFQKIDQLI